MNWVNRVDLVEEAAVEVLEKFQEPADSTGG